MPRKWHVRFCRRVVPARERLSSTHEPQYWASFNLAETERYVTTETCRQHTCRRLHERTRVTPRPLGEGRAAAAGDALKPGRERLRVINERVHTVEVPLLRPLELPRAA